jgi:hypothetical protein
VQCAHPAAVPCGNPWRQFLTPGYSVQHGTLAMNSALPARTEKLPWPSEHILDELRTRSKNHVAPSNATPPASASVSGGGAVARDEAKTKRKEKATRSGRQSGRQTPDPLARELEILLKLEARLEYAHGKLASGSDKPAMSTKEGEHHGNGTSVRTRLNSPSRKKAAATSRHP